MSTQTKKALETVGKRLIDERRSADAILGGVVRLMAEGKLEATLLQLIADSEPVEIPEDFDEVPSLNALEGDA